MRGTTINSFFRGSGGDFPKFFLACFIFQVVLSAYQVHGPCGASTPGAISSPYRFPTLEEIDRVLSGEDSVCIDSFCTVIHTRYAYSPEIGIARDYLVYLIEEGLGYEAVVQRFPLKLERPTFTSIAFSSGYDTLWFGDMGGKLYAAFPDDQGPISISEISSMGEKIYDLTRDSRGRLWAACGLQGGGLGALFVSTDGGVSWSIKASGSEVFSLYSVVFGSETFGMAAGAYGTVLGTANGGRYWFTLDPADFGYHSIMDIESLGPMRYFLVSYFGELFKTDDLGLSWETDYFSTYPLYAMDFHGESHGILVGSGVTYYTEDGGSSWTMVPVDADLRAVAMWDSSIAVAAGSDGEIWMSEDGGVSWERIGAACSSGENILDVVCIDESFWMCGGCVVRRLEPIGQTVECEEIAVADTIWGENISFEHRGEVEPDSVIVVCGHYDSISKVNPLLCAPGADDNGSGVISVLHSALALKDFHLRKTVQFVLFDGEEVGLKGSGYFTSHLDTGKIYQCAVNIDMIGYNADDGNTLTIVGRDGAGEDSILTDEFMQVVDELGIGIVCDPFPGAPYASDHYSFWDRGIPAILLIEGRKGEGNGWTPNYHTCNDTYESVDFDFVADCVETVAGVVRKLAGVVSVPIEEAVSRPVVYQNSPNPFSDETEVEYIVPFSSYAELTIYDVAGRRLCTIDRGYREGKHRYSVGWDGTVNGGKLPSGIYFLHLKTDFGEASRKVVIVR